MMKIGSRLAEARRNAGLTQLDVAAALGDRYSQQMVSQVECGRWNLLLDGTVKAARVLGVSLDYLTGLTDDPAPVDGRVNEAEERAAREAEARIRREEARNREQLEVALQHRDEELDRLRARAKGPRTIERFRPIADLDVEAAAGPEAYVEKEPVIGHLAFREDWLAGKGINPDKCSIIQVRGRSMEPTLQAGSRILVDRQRTRRLRDRIFVVWTEDGVVVKRLARDGDDWILVSDNADYPPIPWPEGAEVVGQIMWTGRTL